MVSTHIHNIESIKLGEIEKKEVNGRTYYSRKILINFKGIKEEINLFSDYKERLEIEGDQEDNVHPLYKA